MSGTGPAVAALGGGHGLAATLRAARRYAGTVTAVVSVADDGGSSGRLREAFGILPPGDLRKCLVALGRDGTVWADALEYRFTAGELEGHALGNLLLAGLAAVTGSWQVALEEVGGLVRAEGRILPATSVPVVLKATAEGTEVHGQEAVARTARIDKVAIVPPDTPAPPAAVAAVRDADQVILGPGSLYTSVLAVTAVPDLLVALGETRATRVYVCNLRPQVSETAGYTAKDHLAALSAHGVTVDCVVCDPAAMDTGELDVRCIEAPLARADGLGHDPDRLAAVLAGLVG